jgi:hypothetical protein
MAWIKISHTAGVVMINMDQVYTVQPVSTDQIQVVDANSIVPASYTFSSQSERDSIFKKMIRILEVIELDKLANQ